MKMSLKKQAAKPAAQEPKAGAKKKRKLIQRAGNSLFILPSLVGVLTFFLVPYFIVLYYSMVDNPINGTFVGFQNFIRIFQNNAFISAALNTLKFSLTAVPLAVVLSLILAMLLMGRIPFRTQLRTFFLSPLMVPTASIVLIWQVLFHYNGVVNVWLQHFDIQKIDWVKSAHGQIVIVILFVWKNLGYNMILFMAALSSIPKEILEVALLESATPWQIFFKIKLRYLSSTILFVTIMSLINSFKVFREIYLLTTDYPYDTLYMLQHFMNNTFRNLDYQKLSAAAIVMSLAMIVIIGILFLTENYFGRDVEG